MVFEYDNKNEGNYGPIKSYLSESDKNLLEIDLISMYFSSFKTFVGQINIQNLSNLEICDLFTFLPDTKFFWHVWRGTRI